MLYSRGEEWCGRGGGSGGGGRDGRQKVVEFGSEEKRRETYTGRQQQRKDGTHMYTYVPGGLQHALEVVVHGCWSAAAAGCSKVMMVMLGARRLGVVSCAETRLGGPPRPCLFVVVVVVVVIECRW